MLDTADKSGGALRKVMSDTQINQFISHAKEHNLITGLAGSLSKDDIVPLMQQQPDYLGFRGAICQGNDRKVDLDEALLNEIKTLIHKRRKVMAQWRKKAKTKLFLRKKLLPV